MRRIHVLIIFALLFCLCNSHGRAEELFPTAAPELFTEGAISGTLGLFLMALLPMVKGRASFTKYKRAVFWVQIAVYAAEKRYGAGQGGRKLAFVQEFLARRKVRMDAETLNAMVDAELERLERGACFSQNR